MRSLMVICMTVLIAGPCIPPRSSNAAEAVSKKDVNPLYVYSDYPSRENHYIPSGYMGDYGDLKVSQHYKIDPADGETCIRIEYTNEKSQGANWAGIYWQQPWDNWGNKKGGFNLGERKKLTFKAKGKEGGEYIDKFMIGGIAGQVEEGDTDEAYLEGIELSKEWKSYEIDLRGYDLSYIIGGFGFAISSASNFDRPVVFYLDEIRYER